MGALTLARRFPAQLLPKRERALRFRPELRPGFSSPSGGVCGMRRRFARRHFSSLDRRRGFSSARGFHPVHPVNPVKALTCPWCGRDPCVC